MISIERVSFRSLERQRWIGKNARAIAKLKVDSSVDSAIFLFDIKIIISSD
jgi:hypothetical protein